MLQISVENLGNSFKNALDTGDWGSFVGAILTSAPMLISSLTQIRSGLLNMTQTASISAVT
jgi:hypothetical protein